MQAEIQTYRQADRKIIECSDSIIIKITNGLYLIDAQSQHSRIIIHSLLETPSDEYALMIS